jgi:ABC-type spermidine/putrescine transport system permease subunit II
MANIQGIWIKNRADFLSGLLFTGLGLLGLFLALQYDMGTARRMGPGFFPVILCAILVALGVMTIFISLSLRSKDAADDEGSSRDAADDTRGLSDVVAALRASFFVVAALIVFALSLRRVGLVLAVTALVFIASFADRSLSWLETALIAAFMSFVAVAVFRWGIGLPFQVWP